ncbi:MAG TPA: diaminopimelate epimerase [Parafilimonas sp.]|nr:diaminopimelate epimerase [Parafilimonas sp.]
MNFSFSKYQGTGNDFIIIDNRESNIELSAQQVKKLCDRHFGIGADGLMLMNNHSSYDFTMKYYNADGNESSMCGNGGRCMVQFAYDTGLHKREYFFTAIDGEHKATIEDNGWIDLKMKDVDNVEMYEYSNYILNTGSPHFIKPVSGVWNYDVFNEGKEIRYSRKFAKEGINVNFTQVDEEGDICVRTYERGVENETLSCGTGVTAAALVFAHNDNGFNRVEVKTLGGHLAVEFDKIDDKHFKNIWLCGPAVLTFKGEAEV